ncbi:MAG: hypothetical protein NTW64_07835 [Candidatus Omnitrophica bacterium]|nr:hypothetical protein [Candidatus Omnitrophota bacterium]
MKVKFLSIILIVVPSIAYAQSYPIVRATMMEQALAGMGAQMKNLPIESQKIPTQDIQRYYVPEPVVRPKTYAADKKMNVKKNKVVEKSLRDITIELALEYMFAAQGKQVFEVVDSQGGLISRLTFPNEGQMLILKAEAGFRNKFFLSGRYGNSQFSKKICSDEDWNLPIDPPDPLFGDNLDYQITRQDSKPKVEIFDVNLYYRLLDLDKDKAKQEGLSSGKMKIFENLMVDKLSFDIFVGYQQQKGRYSMIDPWREYLIFDGGIWYSYEDLLPADIGLDSFYKIEYKGPRLGIRTQGSRGKFTTKLRFAYAWLETKAYGWWNMREYSFWQSGTRGYGIDTGLEVDYSFFRSFSIGVGFNYLYCRQKKLKESGVMEVPSHYEYYDEDIIRNANSEIYGPSFILKYIW